MEKTAATRLPVGTCRPTFLPCEIQLRYTPFDIDLNEISQTDLATLREVSEGWYVEYKSEVTNPRSLAKSLSSFANRYGGWLILGVQENPKDHTAASFPGVPNSDLTSILQQLRDAAKDLLQPTLPLFHHILTGPLADNFLAVGAHNHRRSDTGGCIHTLCPQRWSNLYSYRGFLLSCSRKR